MGELRGIFDGVFDRELPSLPPAEAEALFQGKGALKVAKVVRPLSKAAAPCSRADLESVEEILGRVLEATEVWGGPSAEAGAGAGADGDCARRAAQASLRTLRRLKRAADLKVRATRALEAEDSAAFEALWEEAEGAKTERARKVFVEALVAAGKDYEFRVWQEQKEHERQERARTREREAREARRRAREAQETKKAENEANYAKWLEGKLQGSRVAQRHVAERLVTERQEISLRATQNRLSSDAEFERWVKEKERQRQVLRDSQAQRELAYRRTLEKRKIQQARLERIHQAREEQWA